MNEQFLNYVKEGLSKGYSEEQLRKILAEHNVDEADIDEIFMTVKAEQQNGPQEQVAEQQQPQEMMQPKPHARLFSLLIVGGGLLLMIAVYLVRIFVLTPPEEELAPALAILKGFWPFVFPIAANVANFFLFRKKFFLGLIITVLVIIALVAVVILFSAMGA